MMRKWSGEKMKETNLIPHTIEVMYFNVSARTKAYMNAAAFGGCLYWLCASLENQALISTQWETSSDTST